MKGQKCSFCTKTALYGSTVHTQQLEYMSLYIEIVYKANECILTVAGLSRQTDYRVLNYGPNRMKSSKGSPNYNEKPSKYNHVNGRHLYWIQYIKRKKENCWIFSFGASHVNSDRLKVYC